MQILELHVLTSSIEQTRKFYQEGLGLTLEQASEDLVQFKLPHTRLFFHQATSGRPEYHIAFNIPANQIKQALEWISARAEIIPLEPGNPVADFRNWNAEAFYFYDNNHNILELITRRDLHNEQAGDFDHRSILSVSEVGIVTKNVSEYTGQLKQEYRLDYFEKQKPTPHFAAMGDDQGLLI